MSQSHSKILFLKTPEIRNEKTFSDQFFRAQKKKRFPNFSPAAAFFSLWRHWKPLKTVKKPLKPLKTLIFWHFFPKTVKFFKKGTPKIFRLRRAFFRKSPRSKWGGGPKTYLDPPWRGMLRMFNYLTYSQLQKNNIIIITFIIQIVLWQDYGSLIHSEFIRGVCRYIRLS